MNNFFERTSKVVHACGQEQTRTAYTCGAPTLDHPVPIKSRNEACSVCSDLLCLIAKLEKGSISVNEPGRVGERDAEIESLNELEIRMTKFENVDLGNIEGWVNGIGE